MKKILTIIGMILTTFLIVVLAATFFYKKDINNFLNDIEIIYNDGENASSVKSDLELPMNLGDDLILVWESSNFDIISIKDGKAIVNRNDKDRNVILTVYIKKDRLKSKKRDFNIKVLKYSMEEKILDEAYKNIDFPKELTENIELDNIYRVEYNNQIYNIGLTWDISNSEYLFILDNQTLLVTRYKVDVKTEISVILKLNNYEKIKTFKVFIPKQTIF